MLLITKINFAFGHARNFDTQAMSITVCKRWILGTIYKNSRVRSHSEKQQNESCNKRSPTAKIPSQGIIRRAAAPFYIQNAVDASERHQFALVRNRFQQLICRFPIVSWRTSSSFFFPFFLLPFFWACCRCVVVVACCCVVVIVFILLSLFSNIV